jgi:hypothetical protein
MHIQKLYIGGWFQRTTLHLTEIWDLLKHGTSHTGVSKHQLQEARSQLGLLSVTRENGLLEYLLVDTTFGIQYRIYEDGLIILEKPLHSLKKDCAAIKTYYDTRLSKSLSVLFSKGAPVPKELANIKTILPYIVTTAGLTAAQAKKLFVDAGEEVYSVLSTAAVEVHRSPGLIVINNLHDEALARAIIESQVFFREFKSQLHRYLTIHRVLWEKIRKIKERGTIQGTEVDDLRNELSVYQKTITLIGARIDQMPAYVHTRQKITSTEHIDKYLQPLFEFKFETLLDTHEYIKHLWSMTQSYLDSAVEVFTELQAKSTKNTISSLQLITTIGVVAGILGYLGKDTLPKFTGMGLLYFGLLMLMTWIINSAVSRFYKHKRYKIKIQEIEKDIK